MEPDDDRAREDVRMTADLQVAHRVARAELVKRALILTTTVLVAVLLVTQWRTVALIRSTQQTGSPVLQAIGKQNDDIQRGTEASVSTNEQILDCLTPGGECFERSRTNSSNTVASINEVTAYAAVCADRPGVQSLAAIRLCIADLISAGDRARPAS